MRTTDGNLKPLGYQTLTVSNAAVALTVPTVGVLRARAAILQARAGVGDIKWRDDGTNPTAGAGGGMDLYAGNDFFYSGDLDAIRFIRDAAVDGTLQVVYYQ